MYNIGDRVSQVLNNKTIPKGTIGFIEKIVTNQQKASRTFYEVRFEFGTGVNSVTEYRLRYESEIMPAPVNTSTSQQMQQAMNLPTPPKPVSVNPFMAALKKQATTKGQLTSYTHPQSNLQYLVEDIDDHNYDAKIIKVNGDSGHAHVGSIRSHKSWAYHGWLGVTVTGSMNVTTKLNKCTCGAEKTFGIDSGHSSWCDKAKAS